MDASETAAASNTAASPIVESNSASDDAAVNNASVAAAGGKIIPRRDDDKILQSVFDKSTTTTIDQEKVQKAISFLSNVEIRNVPPSEKRRYLTSKGMNQDEIDTALDRLATAPPKDGVDNRGAQIQGGGIHQDDGRSYQQHQQQQQQNYQQQHRNPYGGPPPPSPQFQNHNNMQSSPHTNNMHNNFGPNNNMGNNNIRPEQGGGESSFLSLSSLAGGFCISTFCLAAVRWLNGGDFVLFPPPVVGGRSIIKHDDDKDMLHQEEDDGETTDDQLDETSFHSQGSGDPNISMILNNGTTTTTNQDQTSSSSFEDLVMEVKALSSTINSFREEQDRANRVATAQLGKGVTDDAMDFLRQQKPPPPVVQKKGGDNVDVIIDKKDVSRIASLITDMVTELSEVKDSLDDVQVADGSDNTEADDGKKAENDDGKKADHSALSSKIDSAIEKGREILDLVKSPEERDGDKIIESQQASSAEHGNDAKNNTQDPNEATQVGMKDEDKTDESNPTPAADEDSGESSETKKDSKDIEEALKTLAQNNESQELKIGAQMLYLYCKNLSKNPTVPRYRKIYTNNNSFKKKVGNLVGVKDFLTALGFVERTNFFEWSDISPDTKSQLDFALIALEQLQKGQEVEDTEIIAPSKASDTSEDNKSEKD